MKIKRLDYTLFRKRPKTERSWTFSSKVVWPQLWPSSLLPFWPERRFPTTVTLLEPYSSSKNWNSDGLPKGIRLTRVNDRQKCRHTKSSNSFLSSSVIFLSPVLPKVTKTYSVRRPLVVSFSDQRYLVSPSIVPTQPWIPLKRNFRVSEHEHGINMSNPGVSSNTESHPLRQDSRLVSSFATRMSVFFDWNPLLLSYMRKTQRVTSRLITNTTIKRQTSTFLHRR